MITNTFPDRPKLARCSGIWFCTGGSISASGPTMKAAYNEYQRQKRVMERWCETDAHRNTRDWPLWDRSL
jgi:hypothetical protein